GIAPYERSRAAHVRLRAKTRRAFRGRVDAFPKCAETLATVISAFSTVVRAFRTVVRAIRTVVDAFPTVVDNRRTVINAFATVIDTPAARSEIKSDPAGDAPPGFGCGVRTRRASPYSFCASIVRA